MNLEYCETQRLLRDALRSFFASAPAVSGGGGVDKRLWTALADDCGVLGVGVPSEMGGTDGGAVEIMIVMEELGAALVAQPYVETIVMGASLLRWAGGTVATEALKRIAGGEMILAFAWAEAGGRHDPARVDAAARREASGWVLSGTKAMVVWAPNADAMLVTARTGADEALSLFIVENDRPGVVMTTYPTLDGRMAADVLLDNVVLPDSALLGGEGRALPAVERAVDEAIAAICSEAVGILRAMLRQTVAYAQARNQFGQAISGFQALQHRMADMFLETELASAAALLATLSLDSPRAARRRAVSAAKVTIAKACRFVGQSAIQLHGGMGMSDALPVTRFFKRATVIEGEFGGVDYHIGRRLER